MKKTRQIISVFLSVCMIISCMAGFTFTVIAEDDPRIIVSLGDSYSAGEGNAPYYGSGEPIADRVQNQDWLAHRSQSSWGSQLTLSGVPMTRDENWFFAAASNAKTDDLTDGGGVYNAGTLIIENGSKITISGNGTEEKTCNVYLKDGAALTVNSTPAAGSEIGISTETLPTATAPVTITSDCKGSADYFTSDNDAYQIVNDGDAAQLIVKPIVIFDKNGGTGNMADSTAVVGKVYELPGCGFEPPADKMFDHWEISGDDGIYYPGNKPVIAANMMQDGVITVTAKWVTRDYEPRVKPIPSSGSGSTSSGSSSSSDVSGSSETNVKMWAQLNDDNSITVGWNKISAVSKYVLYYEKDGKQVKITETSKTKVLIKNAKNNFTYKFTLKVKQGGDIIDAPTGYKISFNCYYKPVVKLTAKDGKVTASWKKVTGAEKYRVYKLVNGKLKLVAETTKNAVRFNVKSGKTYTYAVSALVNDGWTELVKSDRASIKVK